MLKLYQFWLGIGLFLLALLLGWGLPMIIPSTLHNGILITIVGFVISAPFLIWAYVLYRRQIKSQEKSFPLEKIEETKSDNLTEILTGMHRRMMYLKTIRSNKRFDKKKFEKAMPLLFDRLGIVKLNDWDDFKKKIGKRIKRHVPKSLEKRKKKEWYYKVLGDATEIRRELLDCKKWQIEDVIEVGEWLDSLHVGLGGLRDNDETWQGFFEMTKPYMNDPILRELLNKHIACSYACCSSLLYISYGDRLPKNNFSQLLYPTLVGSNISPHEIEIALSEILEEITTRLKELQIMSSETEKTIIKDAKVKLDADEVDKATGMEINNVQAHLSNVQVDVTAKNVKEAKGLSVTAHNTEFALSSRVIMCSCGNTISSVTTCGYKPVITCPKCGKEYEVRQ